MAFNTEEFNIWGIPPYLFCSCIATVVAICAFIIFLSNKGYKIDPYLKCLAFAIAGLAIVARLFGCISGVYGALGRKEAITWDTVKNTGIVFYGGLIGMLITYRLMLLRVGDIEKDSTLDILTVTIPLFHSISRIGCFLGGCCYGSICRTPISILYTTDVMGEIVSAERIPIQLIEALLNFVLFIYLFSLFRKDDWHKQHIYERYLLIYSALRFILEFFRGDEIRGVVAGISFSQLVSIFIWISLAIKHKLRNRKMEGLVYEGN